MNEESMYLSIPELPWVPEKLKIVKDALDFYLKTHPEPRSDVKLLDAWTDLGIDKRADIEISYKDGRGILNWQKLLYVKGKVINALEYHKLKKYGFPY